MLDRPKNDERCLKLWRKEGDAPSLNTLIGRYQGKVFAFVLYLSGCDWNTAYEVTAQSFVETLAGGESSSGKAFSSLLFNKAMDQCRSVKAARYFDASKFVHAPESRKNILQTARKALAALSFDERTVLLLRDQANLTYDEIGRITKVPLREIKVRTERARNQFRERIEQRLKS